MFKSTFQIFVEELVQTLLSLIKIILWTKYSKYPRFIKIKKCIILTNGPSLSDLLEKNEKILRGADVICVNHFPNFDYYEKLKPKYYVTTAPDLWLDDIEEKYVNNSKKLFDTMAKTTSWKLFFFIPHEAKKYKRWQKQLAENTNINIVYFNNTPIEGFPWFCHKIFDLKWGMPRPHNVLIPCLCIGINMRYEKIYILGADHSWLPEIVVHNNNRVLIDQKHFYDKYISSPAPLDKKGKGERKLHEILTKFVFTFQGYHILEKYSRHKKIKIINVTSNSYIDAFERIAPEEFQEQLFY